MAIDFETLSKSSNYSDLEKIVNEPDCPEEILIIIAQSPVADSKLLSRLLTKSDSWLVHAFVANNVAASPQLLEEIWAKTDSERVRIAVIDNPNLSEKFLSEIVQTFDFGKWDFDLIRSVVNRTQNLIPLQKIMLTRPVHVSEFVGRGSTNAEMLHEIALNGPVEAQLALFANLAFSRDLVSLLLLSKNAEVRAMIAKRIADLNSDEITKLVSDEAAVVRQAIAQYPVEDLELLLPLTRDKLITVRRAISTLDVTNFSGREPKQDKRRTRFLDAVTDFESGAGVSAMPKKKVTISDLLAQIRVERITADRARELTAEKSVSLRVAGILRSLEVGIATPEETVKALEKLGSTAIAPRDDWFLNRAQGWKEDPQPATLKLAIQYKIAIEEMLAPGNELTEELLLAIINHKYGRWNKVALENQTLSENCLVALAESEIYFLSTAGKEYVQEIVLGRNDLTERVFAALFNCKFKQVKVAVCNHVDVPERILLAALLGTDPDVRAAALRNPRTPFVSEVGMKGAKTKAARLAIICTQPLKPKDLVEMASDNIEELRVLAASHPDTPVSAYEKLALDSEQSVRIALRDNPGVPAELKALSVLA